VPLNRLIGAPAAALAKRMQINVVADLAGRTRQELIDGVDWQARNKDGDEIVDRINTALQQIGLEPIR
jgi:hypothetical protein